MRVRKLKFLNSQNYLRQSQSTTHEPLAKTPKLNSLGNILAYFPLTDSITRNFFSVFCSFICSNGTAAWLLSRQRRCSVDSWLRSRFCMSESEKFCPKHFNRIQWISSCCVDFAFLAVSSIFGHLFCKISKSAG